MQIDATQIIRDFYGHALLMGEDELTLGDAILQACLRADPEDGQKPGQALRAFKLAQKFADGGQVEISTDDATFIKARLEKIGAPLLVGRVHEMLDEHLGAS